ncbi:MAG TPA: hypothetical protein VKY26_07100, partial [Actinomycetota bacterium]|nr:hypothetical protein [Actinomycetota bacterium]
RLLAGKAPLGGDDAPEIRQFFQDLRSRYKTEAPASVQQEHLARIVAAARAHNPQATPPWQPAGARAGSGSGDGRPPWRRKIVLSSIFGSITTKILVGVVAAAAATGGLAAAGALPTPVQNAVASAAGGVGVGIPNPQASASAAALAQGQKVVSAVTNLVKQVSDTDQQTASLTSNAIQSSTTCTQNVAGTASALSGLSATTFSGAQSLAARATALAQESVGCGLPDADADAAATATVHASVTGTVHSDALAAGKAIAGAVQSCAGPLKSAIQTLVQAAISGKSASDIANLSTDAKAVATAAQACAEDIAAALKGLNLTPIPLPTALPTGGPKLPLPFTLPTIKPTGLPTITATAHTGAGLGSGSALTDPSQWLKLLSQLPGLPTPSADGSASVGASTGYGSWTGMTGSWTGTTWNPYTGSGSDGSKSGSTGGNHNH